jgi:hypothetical protein
MGITSELLNRLILRIYTTEYTELHGGRKDCRIKTPWYSVSSVVYLLLLFKEIKYER